jgi:hypothetical protein
MAGTVAKLQAEQPGIRIPSGARNIYPLQNVRKGSGTHPTTFLLAIGVPSGNEAAGA